LTSLQRRTPALPEAAVTVAKNDLSPYFDALAACEEGKAPPAVELNNVLSVDTLQSKVMPGTLTLLDDQNETPRWESLAVGLFLSMTLLEQFAMEITTRLAVSDNGAGAAAQASSSHYVDGPRLPSFTPQTTEGTAATGDGTNGAVASATVPLPSLKALSDFTNSVVLNTCQKHLEHSEPRVRTLVARTIGAHARLTTLIVFPQASGAGVDVQSMFAEEDNSTAADNVLVLQKQVAHMYNVIESSLVEQYKYKRSDVGSTDATGTLVASTDISKTKTTGLDSEAAKRTMVALDDTTGWRALETSLHALASWLDGYGTLYWSNTIDGTDECLCDLLVKSHAVNKDGHEEMTLLQMMEDCCTKHINRHVRAAALQTMDQLVASATTASATMSSTTNTAYRALYDPLPALAFLRRSIVSVLGVTLADNWSQVRMAASVLCRSLLSSLLAEQKHQAKQSATVNAVEEGASVSTVLQTQVYPKLLPRMCLNRFYLAQGVKLFSQETWEIVFQAEASHEEEAKMETSSSVESIGAGMVARHAGAVARYYAKMADADNHVVREAACQAIAELAQKIGGDEAYSDYLEPHVPVLLQSLIMCFFDESWPVRDEASLACGTFARAYPEVCRPELPTLMERWIEQMTDQIWSVREDAGIALGDAVVAYGQPVLDTIVTKMRELIPSARTQPAETKEQMLAKHNDPAAHTDNQLYSCGSLAPKLGRGSASARAVGGCSDCKMTRDRMPWEATDGCIYLMRELFKLGAGADKYANSDASKLLDDTLLKSLYVELVDVCRVRHFPQADDMRATLFRQVPEMARAVGKLGWKRKYLDAPGFLELMIETMQDRTGDTSQLAVHAAGSCASELAALVGKGILVGRVEDDRLQSFLEQYLASRSPPAYGPGMIHGGAMAAGGPPAPIPGRVPW
jgi:hypothetical protein